MCARPNGRRPSRPQAEPTPRKRRPNNSNNDNGSSATGVHHRTTSTSGRLITSPARRPRRRPPASEHTTGGGALHLSRHASHLSASSQGLSPCAHHHNQPPEKEDPSLVESPSQGADKPTVSQQQSALVNARAPLQLTRLTHARSRQATPRETTAQPQPPSSPVGPAPPIARRHPVAAP